MRHLQKLQLESKELEVFEVERLLVGFLKDKGIKADVQKHEDFFNVFISSYAEDEGPKRVPVKKLLDYFKSLNVSEDAEVTKTKFGYTIQMLKDGQSEKLMEAVEEDEGHKCIICENTFFGLGNDPWPVYTKLEERVCNDCKVSYVIPARLEFLRGSTQNSTRSSTRSSTRTEAADRSSIEHATSNLVLDDKFIWLFNVLDSNGEDIEEGIEYLQDAIDVLVATDASFLVAFPYIDPKPEDKSVDLVFADNPGPIIVYNKEEATVSKGKLEKPSKEVKPKEEAVEVKEESTVVEAETDFSQLSKDLQLIRKALLTANDHLMFKDWDDITKAWFNVSNAIARFKLKNESIIREATDETPEGLYSVVLIFKKGFYNTVGADAEAGEEAYNVIKSYVVYLEEALEEEGIYLGFYDDFIGRTYDDEDFYSSGLPYDEAVRAKEWLEAYEGDYLEVHLRQSRDKE